MNRVTFLAPAQRDIFGGFGGPLVELCSAVYDPEVTIFTEALEGTGVAEAVSVADQSHYLSGEGWIWDPNLGGLTCQGCLAKIEVLPCT